MEKTFEHTPSKSLCFSAHYRHEDEDTGEVTLRGYEGDIEFSYQVANYKPTQYPFFGVKVDGDHQYYELHTVRPKQPYEGDSNDPDANEKRMSELLAADLCRHKDVDYCIVDLHTEYLIQRNLITYTPPGGENE